RASSRRRREGGAGCGTCMRGCYTSGVNAKPRIRAACRAETCSRGTTAPAGPAAVNAKAERCRVARQEGEDASAQGCVRPLARGRPVTPGRPCSNAGHAPLGAPPLAFGGGGKEGDYGPTPAPAPRLGTISRCLLGCLTVVNMEAAVALPVGLTRGRD